MNDQPLVSIIIPTYNRAHLIAETLDSVLGQSYSNWECIIVDDGSKDNTDEVVGVYVEKDSRFKYYHRPKEHLPGGNGARNYGYKLSRGSFIQWFDSDDLMDVRYLHAKVEFMTSNDVDFSVSQTVNFVERGKLSKVEKYTSNRKNEISLLNFINQKVYWMTPDFFVKRVAVQCVKFSETLKSGQETNFFIRFLTLPVKGEFLDEELTYRRIHENSIRKSVETDSVTSNKNKSISLLDAYNSIFKSTDAEVLTALENHIVRALYRSKFDIPLKQLESLAKGIMMHRGILQLVNFVCLVFFARYNKGYTFYNKFQSYG